MVKVDQEHQMRHHISIVQPLVAHEDASDGHKGTERPGSFHGSIFNVANSAIGAGVLAFPIAFSRTGIGLGIALTAFFALFLGYTLHILARVTIHLDCSTYQEAAARTIAPWAGYTITGFLVAYLFGASCAYLNVIFDQVHPVLIHFIGDGHWITDHRFPLLATACIALLPLCLLRNISFLSTPSTVAVLSIVYMAVLVVGAGIKSMTGHDTGEGVVAARLDVETLRAVPIICFALQCHLVFVPVAHEMREQTVRAADKVIVLAFAVCLCLYLPVGVAGYAKFGDAVKDDILESFDTSDAEYTLARGCIGLTALLSYPLLHFVARDAIYDLLSWTKAKHMDVTVGETAKKEAKQKDAVRWVGSALAYLAGTLLVAIYVPKISTVLTYTGAIGAVTPIFIFPGLMLRGDMPDKRPSDRLVGTSMIVFGVVLGVACTVVVVGTNA